MQEKLIAWIEGNQDYEQGLLLYNEYGTSSLLKKVLAAGPTAYNRTKLLDQLQQLYASLPEQKAVDPLDIIAQQLPDEELKAQLINERKSCHQQAAYLKAQLPLIQDQAKRKSIAFKILDLHDRNNEIFAMLEYRELHGIFPNKVVQLQAQGPETPLSIAEIQRELLKIRPKISRIKDNADKVARYQELMQEKFRLEQLIAKANAI